MKDSFEDSKNNSNRSSALDDLLNETEEKLMKEILPEKDPDLDREIESIFEKDENETYKSGPEDGLTLSIQQPLSILTDKKPGKEEVKKESKVSYTPPTSRPLSKHNKVYTTESKRVRKINHGSMGPFSEIESLEEVLDIKPKEEGKGQKMRNFTIQNLLAIKKNYNLNTTFIDDLVAKFEAKELLREDYRLYDILRNQAHEEDDADEIHISPGFVTYESVIILNFDCVLEGDDVITTIQLSSKTYASDSCTPLKVEPNKYSEMSKFRVVPQLKYESHLQLIEELSKEGINPEIENYYDHFYQEGESNIKTQIETKGKPV